MSVHMHMRIQKIMLAQFYSCFGDIKRSTDALYVCEYARLCLYTLTGPNGLERATG